ncbi:SpoIIE family protein phosphatase [Nocardioides sp. YIM 152315]|uniref:PP2C family protein-serine/threonine phosphatase n=1 Tax=Nocardioides sp. YIM 152315 TaxID=3031760 RepID=UPI0023DC5D07|nr:SpoIIE family protein phosphatase [Nocardioides sp. YIM 152315]MDF1603504.1 SpoIIE family protein phosphatase [Nocardioides sp. YIM 152315]
MPARRPPYSARAVVRVVSALVVLLSVVVGVLLAVTVRQFVVVQDRLEHELNPARVELSTILALYVDQETAERGYILTGRSEFLEPYDEAAPRIDETLDDLDGQVSPVVRERVAAMDQAHRAWLSAAAEPELAAARSGDREGAVELVGSGDGRRLFDQVRAAHERADEAVRAEQDDASRRADSLLRRLSVLLALTVVAFLATILAGAGAFSRAVLRPLAELGRSSRSVAQGELHHAVQGSGPREISEVADDVDTMRRHLLDELDASRRASEALVLGEPAVRALQAALSRLSPPGPGLEVAAQIESAEGVLAGDFLDIVRLDGGRTAVVLGDVSGHGHEAAVVGLRLKSALSTMLQRTAAPEVLAAVRDGLAGEPELFATIFVALVDPGADRIDYVNAGHPPPCVVSADGVTELGPTGPLVSGVITEGTWSVAACPFRAGDLLVAFSDGLLEARDETGAEFGTDGVAAVLRDGADGAPDLITTRMRSAVRDHARRQRDDVTILVARRT